MIGAEEADSATVWGRISPKEKNIAFLGLLNGSPKLVRSLTLVIQMSWTWHALRVAAAIGRDLQCDCRKLADFIYARHFECGDRVDSDASVPPYPVTSSAAFLRLLRYRPKSGRERQFSTDAKPAAIAGHLGGPAREIDPVGRMWIRIDAERAPHFESKLTARGGRAGRSKSHT